MTRAEAMNRIAAQLAGLPDDRIEALAELAESWSKPTVYSTLPVGEKVEIDAALDDLDRGEGVPLDVVRKKLRQKLEASNP